MEHAARFAGTRQVVGSLKEVQIDHTPIDLIALDETRRYVLGRMWLTLVMCTASRAVLGFYLSFDAPSMESVARAMAMSVLPKHDLLAALGLSNMIWDAYGLGEEYFTDRAAEFRCDEFLQACKNRKITCRLRPVGKKHWGGHVERLIGTIMGKLHMLPGTTFSNTKLRKHYNAEGSAMFSASEVLKIVATEIVEYMHTPHGPLGITPQQAFHDGLPQHEGAPIMPALVKDPRQFLFDFMPKASAKNCKDGLHWRKNWYFSDLLRDIPLGQKITFIPDSNKSGQIILLHPAHHGKTVPRQNPVMYDDVSYEKELRAAKRQRALAPECVEQVELAQSVREGIIAAAAAAKKAALKAIKQEQGAPFGLAPPQPALQKGKLPLASASSNAAR